MKRLWLVVLCAAMAGCALPQRSAELTSGDPVTEAAWIREGEPINLDGGVWYPTREVEALLASEILPAGQYRGVDIFVERADIKPYARLYTKFAKNRYRAFEPQR